MPIKMSARGRAMCRYCSTDEGVQTYACPFKHCEKVALCQPCAATHPGDKTKSGHRAKGCEREAASARAERAERKALSDCGHYVYAACRQAREGITHAIFRCGEEKLGVYLPDSLAPFVTSARNLTLARLIDEIGFTPPEAPSEFDSPDCAPALDAALPLLLSAAPPTLITERPHQREPQLTMFV